MLLNSNGIKLEINRKKYLKILKYLENKKNILLNNTWVKKKILREMKKSITIIYHINRIKKKNHTILICEEALAKVQPLFIKKKDYENFSAN